MYKGLWRLTLVRINLRVNENTTAQCLNKRVSMSACLPNSDPLLTNADYKLYKGLTDAKQKAFDTQRRSKPTSRLFLDL